MSNVYYIVLVVYILIVTESTGVSYNRIQYNLPGNVFVKNGHYYRNTLFISNGTSKLASSSSEDTISPVKIHLSQLSVQSRSENVVKAVLLNPQDQQGQSRLPVQLPNETFLSEFDALVRRGIPMKALKQLFFNPEIDEDDIIGENITGIPPFLPSKEDKGCKLLGQDEISYMDESNEQIDLDPEVYSINDIVCQTLISSILEYEKNKGTPPKLDLQGEEIGTDDLDTNLLEHFYVSDECGLPYLLYKWNKSYLEGLEHVHPSQKEHYNKVWYQKLNNFLLHHIENFKKVIEIKGEQYFQFEESTSQDKLPRVKIGTKLVKLKPWTEYLSPHILEFVAKSEKYNRVLSGKGATPDRLDDIRAELLKAFIAESQNPFFIKKLEKEKNKLCKEYVRFCYARRHKIKGKPVSPPIMPFWIWHDFWKRRETVFQDTLSEIFNDILLADPHIDLKKITEGTFDKFDVQKENIDDKDLKLIVHDVYIDPEISKLKELVKKQETFRLSNDGPKSEQTNETDKMDAPKPLGYYFKDVISFSKFEDAYKKFNMDNLGTQDYKIYIGQIVKGTVYSVTRDKVVVDIHAFTLATMHLRNYYDSPYDVPIGGFHGRFQEGDQLMFEITEIWPNKITVSLNRIRKMSKFEEIFSQYEQNNIFNVKVLQRYSRGVLVQYTEDFSSFNDNSLSFKNVHDLDNLGWVPINELCGEYKNYNELISRNLVGKTIPVLYDHYDSNNNIPILSNSHAVRKLMLLYLNPGDVVKGRVIRSDKNLALVRIGDIIAFLPVSDMSEDTYQQHLNGYSYDIPAVVTAVDVNKEYVQLSTKTLSKVTVEQLSNVNSYIKKYRKYKDNIETYNMSEHSRGHLESKRERALDYSGIEIMGLSQHKGPSSLRSATTIARTYHEENKHKKWNLLDDNFLEDDVLHAFDTKRWQLYKQDNWVDLPEIEQMVFNRGYNNNDEVCYYKSKGVQYKIDFTRRSLVDLDSYDVYPVRMRDYQP